MKKRQNVMIKGTKDGLVLSLNDQCSYPELLDELEEKLLIHHVESEDSPLISVRIQLGNRYISPEQEEELKELVRNKRNLVVEEVQSNVITKKERNKFKMKNKFIRLLQLYDLDKFLKFRVICY